MKEENRETIAMILPCLIFGGLGFYIFLNDMLTDSFTLNLVLIGIYLFFSFSFGYGGFYIVLGKICPDNDKPLFVKEGNDYRVNNPGKLDELIKRMDKSKIAMNKAFFFDENVSEEQVRKIVSQFEELKAEGMIPEEIQNIGQYQRYLDSLDSTIDEEK